tara:strand:+ start:231 stop:626 length:396 start_codon:yes stop_codon:yes gene_type:complete
MKKVILTLSIIATLFSCTTEEMATTDTQDMSLSRMPIFVGEYLNSQTLINGVVSDTCDKTWSFASTSVNVTDCDDGSWTSGYSFDNDTLFIAQYTTTEIVLIEYPYTEDTDGNLTLTLSTGDFEVTYKLTR